ncbi:MAG: adenylosuccinate lyase, partial [Bacteroidetes bacterium]
PYAHALIAFKAVRKGLSKLLLNEAQLQADLNANWMVLAEAIQNILRREGYPKPYETLKALTRGKTQIGEAEIREFVQNLDIAPEVKQEILQWTPAAYTGRF